MVSDMNIMYFINGTKEQAEIKCICITASVHCCFESGYSTMASNFNMQAGYSGCFKNLNFILFIVNIIDDRHEK